MASRKPNAYLSPLELKWLRALRALRTPSSEKLLREIFGEQQRKLAPVPSSPPPEPHSAEKPIDMSDPTRRDDVAAAVAAIEAKELATAPSDRELNDRILRAAYKLQERDHIDVKVAIEISVRVFRYGQSYDDACKRTKLPRVLEQELKEEVVALDRDYRRKVPADQRRHKRTIRTPKSPR